MAAEAALAAEGVAETAAGEPRGAPRQEEQASREVMMMTAHGGAMAAATSADPVDAAAAANAAVVAAALAALPPSAEGGIDTEALYEHHVRRAKEQLADREEQRQEQRRAERRRLADKYPPLAASATGDPHPKVEFTGQVEIEQQRRREMRHQRQKAATHIQACARRHTVLRTLHALNHLATIIQKNARGRAARCRVAEILDTGDLNAAGKPKQMISEVQRVELASRWANLMQGEVAPLPEPSPDPKELARRKAAEAARQPHWRETRAPLQRKRRTTPRKQRATSATDAAKPSPASQAAATGSARGSARR